jgi:spore coat protein SA
MDGTLGRLTVTEKAGARFAETGSFTRKMSVGVLLSGREKFSPYYGGALARWTYEVYSRLMEHLDVEVFGLPTSREDLYVLPHQTSRFSSLCRLISRIPVARRYEDRLWLWTLMGKMKKLDVLHIHNRPQWVSDLRQLGYPGRLVLHLQNNHLGHWTALMLDGLAPKVDAVAVCSSYLRDTFATKSPALAAKTMVIFNGVNTELFYPREEVREPKTVLFVGRFDCEKGVLELVKAYDRVLRTHPDAKLVIGGTTGFGTHEETPYVRQVRELARSITQSEGKVEFPGYIHHDKDLPSWFQRATIFACPSLFHEPFGLVNAEAMACATPVVGARRGGIPEVLGDTGVLVDPENTEELAGALSALLSRPRSRTRLGLSAHERCRRLFGWDMIARGWVILLRRLTTR